MEPVKGKMQVVGEYTFHDEFTIDDYKVTVDLLVEADGIYHLNVNFPDVGTGRIIQVGDSNRETYHSRAFTNSIDWIEAMMWGWFHDTWDAIKDKSVYEKCHDLYRNIISGANRVCRNLEKVYYRVMGTIYHMEHEINDIAYTEWESMCTQPSRDVVVN